MLNKMHTYYIAQKCHENVFTKTLQKTYLELKLCKILISEYSKCYLLVPYQISLDKSAYRWVKNFAEKH